MNSKEGKRANMCLSLPLLMGRCWHFSLGLSGSQCSVLEDGVGSMVTMNTFFQGTKARQGAVSRKENEHHQKEP